MSEADTPTRREIVCSFLSRVWKALVASLGTTTLAIVVFSVLVPVVTSVGTFVYEAYVQRRPGQSIIRLVSASVFSWPTGISVGIIGLAWVALFLVSVAKTLQTDEVAHKVEVERLRAELEARDQQACIAVEVRECHLNARLAGGFGKAIRSGQVDDPPLAFDVFVYVWMVSSFLHPRGIYGYSLDLVTSAGETVPARWLPNTLANYHKESEEVILDTWGNVSQDRRVKEALKELDTGTMQYTVPSEGWLHFLFDEIRMSDARSGKLIVTVKDSMGITYSGSYEKQREVHGAIWSNQM